MSSFEEYPAAQVLAAGKAVETPMHPVFNPANRNEIVGYSADADRATVDRVVRCASEAGKAWAGLESEARRRLMVDAAKRATDNWDERTHLLTREQGKVLWESAVDLAGAPYLLYECSKLIERAIAEQTLDDQRGRFVTRRRPAGVVAVIVPWNYPIVLAFNTIAPALAAGNTVVVKPSELAPLALTQTLNAVAAVLPPGVLNVVPGIGVEAGSALVKHPLVRRVMFTGGTVTGRSVARSAAENITTVGLELGGNDPALVLESATISDDLINGLKHSAFTCSGQICFAVKRIYVHRSKYADFVSAMKDATNEMTVGNGLDPKSDIGPLINDHAVTRVESLISEARNGGASVTELGSKLDPEVWKDGSFMLPHVVADLSHESSLVAAEQFAPVLPIIPFDSESEAIEMANDSEFGLAASVWSSDDDHAFDVARQIEAGTVFVNVHRAGASDHTTPFGGVKQSGIGRSNGWASIEELTELQMLIRRDDAANLPGPPAK